MHDFKLLLFLTYSQHCRPLMDMSAIQFKYGHWGASIISVHKTNKSLSGARLNKRLLIRLFFYLLCIAKTEKQTRALFVSS